MKSVTRPYVLVVQIALGLLTVGAAIAVAVVLVGPKFPTPLSTTEVAHDHDVTVKQLQDVSSYTAASQHLETIVDIEQKADHLPAALKGERVVFLAEGDVQATVDFSKLNESGIVRSADHTSVTVHLPEPQLTKAQLDTHKSSVVARDRGLIDRAEDALSSTGATSDQRYYEEAERKLGDTANQTELRDRAKTNTTSFVTGLFTAAGYQHVTVLFDAPAPAAAA